MYFTPVACAASNRVSYLRRLMIARYCLNVRKGISPFLCPFARPCPGYAITKIPPGHVSIRASMLTLSQGTIQRWGTKGQTEKARSVKMKNIRMKLVTLEALHGTDLQEVLTEALIYAITNNCLVELEYYDKQWVIDVSDLLNIVVRERSDL